MGFTAGGMFIQESVGVAERYLEERDWKSVREVVIRENLIQARTHSTLVRRTSEILRRLKTLSDQEVEMFVQANTQDRGAWYWLTACRCYRFIADFAVQVLHERFSTFQYLLSSSEFDYFLAMQEGTHPELSRLTERTKDKLRQVLFKMMRDVGLLSDDFRIQPIYLSGEMMGYFKREHPEELLYFPVC
jgi:hypothetical protein